MRLWTVLAFLAAFVASVQAQSALLALAKQLPTCSLVCIQKAIAASTCVTDLTQECICTNEALNAQVTICASQTCTVPELLVTKNVSLTACGAEVRDNGEVFNIIGITGMILAFIAFVMRMAASLGKGGRQVSWDDATMALVVVLAIPPAVFAPVLVSNGLGKDIWTLKPVQITNVLKFYYFGEIFYVVALGISKISILFFYLRVFPAKDFRNIIFAVMGLSVAYTIAFGFATAFQCWPISYAWTQWDGLHEGRCNDIHLQGWVAAAINIALDTVVMVLPLKHLANLNMDLKKKLMVMAMFSVGIFVIFTSAIRLYSLIHFANSQNITWDYVEAGYWSLIEVYVSILCGCMPAHRFVIAKAWPKIKETLYSSKKSTNASSKFTGGTDTNATNKTGTTISAKPKQGDEGDFVPLVDVDTNSARAVSHGSETHTESKSYIMTTSTVQISSSDRPDSWTMGQSTGGKEHV
ncbi:putative cfem domain-containing protein [Neofusicoccum parvum]|uniref:Cfem domain-containing protein n=2 Tax=Neofusicoccum parvum TaxID=310453 RepID=A0ACB5RT48_9PEZI|nr:putative cfem domain-containing protein [Neofusicoccum parvum UCRNP2]GME23665.1 putative cfem domain-containing protein [Neofusicoccum parvum]GME56246.1 putative cfem domain-containing protein [Neofusicoccum parvum]